MSSLPLFTKFLSVTMAAVSTTAGVCEIAAVCTAAWAIFFPKEAADQWVRFEQHIEAARKNLESIAESNQEIAESAAHTAENTASTALSTAATSENTSVVAQYVNELSSMKRGLEAVAIVLTDDKEPEKSEIYLNVGNLSTTPLVDFEFTLLDMDKNVLAKRRSASLTQWSSNLHATIDFNAERFQGVAPPYSAWICASGLVGDTDTKAYFEIALEGYVTPDKDIEFTVVEQVPSYTQSKLCVDADGR